MEETEGLPVSFSFWEDCIKQLVIPATGIFSREYILVYREKEYVKLTDRCFGMDKQFGVLVGGQLIVAENREPWIDDSLLTIKLKAYTPKETIRYFKTMRGNKKIDVNIAAEATRQGFYFWPLGSMENTGLKNAGYPKVAEEYIAVQFFAKGKKELTVRDIRYKISRQVCHPFDGQYSCDELPVVPGELLGGLLLKTESGYGKVNLNVAGILDATGMGFFPLPR
ncbi:MAG TPA: hypothetical protein ENJ95_05595 [Bacteroidetes bacterium]|nr:hypothetical protein [Bacteroidota bacterium]